MPELSISLTYRPGIPRRGPTTPGASSRFGLFRFRSPLLTESILFLFLRLLRCFTSPGIARFSLSLFGKRRWRINTTGLPHSEISGSKRICRSPKLIAACHVLLRLLAPRHSLCALHSLIPFLKSATQRQLSFIPPRGRTPKAAPRFAGLSTGLAARHRCRTVP